MKVTYLSTPYNVANPDFKLEQPTINKIKQERYDEACHFAKLLHDIGVVVISPIIQGVPIANLYRIDDTWDTWKEICRTLIGRCDVLVVGMIPGWEHSVGVKAEIEIAQELGKPVVYLVSIDNVLHYSYRPNVAKMEKLEPWVADFLDFL